jgi:hypothetical protein
MSDEVHMVVTAQAEAPLAELAGLINQAHGQCEEALRAGVGHALRAGELLLEAKRRVAHGQWLAWLKANVRCSPRTAQAYMKVARGKDRLEAKSATVAHLGFREALALLAGPDGPDGPDGPEGQAGAAEGCAVAGTSPTPPDSGSWREILAALIEAHIGTSPQLSRLLSLHGFPPPATALMGAGAQTLSEWLQLM